MLFYHGAYNESCGVSRETEMLRHGEQTLFSASDLVNFMGCAHATVLDVGHLVTPVSFPPDDESAVLLQEKGAFGKGDTK